MQAFGFFPGEPATPQDKVPRGYAVGGARVGCLHETVFCNLATWSIADYLQHWRQAARQCVAQTETVLFCTDLAPKHSCAFVGFASEAGYEFEQWIIPRKDLSVVGTSLGFQPTRSTARQPGASTWHVDLDVIRQFAEAADHR